MYGDRVVVVGGRRRLFETCGKKKKKRRRRCSLPALFSSCRMRVHVEPAPRVFAEGGSLDSEFLFMGDRGVPPFSGACCRGNSGKFILCPVQFLEGTLYVLAIAA